MKQRTERIEPGNPTRGPHEPGQAFPPHGVAEWSARLRCTNKKTCFKEHGLLSAVSRAAAPTCAVPESSRGPVWGASGQRPPTGACMRARNPQLALLLLIPFLLGSSDLFWTPLSDQNHVHARSEHTTIKLKVVPYVRNTRGPTGQRSFTAGDS